MSALDNVIAKVESACQRCEKRLQELRLQLEELRKVRDAGRQPDLSTPA